MDGTIGSLASILQMTALLVMGCSTAVPETTEVNGAPAMAPAVDHVNAVTPSEATASVGASVRASCGDLAPVLGAFLRGHSDAPAPSRINCACQSATPVECTNESDSCAADWKDAEARFRACTSGRRISAFRAHCGSYDAVVYLGRSSTTYTFYAASSGTPAGSVSFSGPQPGMATCQSFLPGFTPPIAKCVPVDPRPCGPESP